jgi:hypothetical protein
MVPAVLRETCALADALDGRAGRLIGGLLVSIPSHFMKASVFGEPQGASVTMIGTGAKLCSARACA